MLPGGTGTTNLTARRGKSAWARAVAGASAISAAPTRAEARTRCERARASQSSPGRPFGLGGRLMRHCATSRRRCLGGTVLGDAMMQRRPLTHPLKPAICARRPSGGNASARTNSDRSLHLDHPQRPQDLHRARGVRAALHRAPGGHRQGRAVQAGVPQDQPQQPHPRDRRPRQRHGADGVGRDPDLPRRQDRQVPAEGRRGALPRDRMADVADGRAGPMFGQVHHFTKYNPGKAPYAEERYLKEAHRLYGVLDKRLGDQRIRRRRLFDRRHGDLAVGLALRVADRRPQQVSQRQALVRRHREAARRCRRATRCRRTSARCRSRPERGRAASLRLDAGVADHLAPARGLALDEGRGLARARARPA